MYYCSLEPTDENLMTILKIMIETNADGDNPIYHIKGWYQRWYQDWFNSGRYSVLTRYELLDDINELKRIIYKLTGITLTEARIKQSMERQAFENLAPKYPHSMRKGIVGDWKNHFKPIHCEYITSHLGLFMLEQNYIEDLEWW
jgi:hypothetical protein